METKIDLLSPDSILEQVKARIIELERLLKEKKHDSKSCNVRILKKGRGFQCYAVTERGDTNGSYVSKTKIGFIKRCVQQNYYKKICREAERQLKMLEKIAANYKPEKSLQIYNDLSPARRQFVNPVVETDEQFVKKWMSVEYLPLDFSDEIPAYYALSGLRVRSKSEIIIADTLEHMNIPYRYEFPVFFEDGTHYCPDFYCLNKRTRQEFLWEHFGMLDNESYAARTVTKLNKYRASGYTLGKNLIATFETSSVPLTSNQVAEMIKEYLV